MKLYLFFSELLSYYFVVNIVGYNMHADAGFCVIINKWHIFEY